MQILKITGVLSLCLILFFPAGSRAQQEKINWLFGNHSGITFSGGTPSNITGSAMGSLEGTSVVSDASGSLLFYTDGVTVYNKLHSPMPSGTGLQGHASSTQSAIIIKKPGSSTHFYVFTADAGEYIDPPSEGIHYSEIDMTLDGNKGDIIPGMKNIFLTDSSTEKLCATYHTNGTDNWVMTHRWNSDKFYAFLVSSSGVNTVPVISSSGTAHSGNNDNTIGQMKFSQQANKLALAVNISGFFELFDFDNATGLVSNSIFLQIPQFISAYGVEFSCNGSRLYVSTLYFNSVYQYDLLAGSPAAIINSRTIVGSTTSGIINGAMQLAADNKIYMAMNSGMSGHPYLSKIDFPDLSGTSCGFLNNAFYLGGSFSFLGLPSFIASGCIISGMDDFFAATEFSWNACYYQNTVFINTLSDRHQHVDVCIYDLNKRKLFHQQKEIVVGNKTIVEKLKLVNGVYLVEVRNKYSVAIKKIVAVN